MSVVDSSSSLIAAVRNRDQQAWQRLADIYGPTIFRWAQVAGLQSADAADVVQEVFQAVASHIHEFDHDRPKGSFRGWVWTIFRSKLMDYFRRRKGQPVTSLPADVQDWTESVDTHFHSHLARQQEQAEQLRRALEVIRGDFQERTWNAFWRSAVLHERTSEIALDLQMTSAAVCVARSRVIRRLRETIDGLDILPAE